MKVGELRKRLEGFEDSDFVVFQRGGNISRHTVEAKSTKLIAFDKLCQDHLDLSDLEKCGGLVRALLLSEEAEQA